MRANTLLVLSAIVTLTGCAGQSAGTAALGGSDLASAGAAAGMTSAVAESAPMASQESGLVDLLVSQLGVTPAQATGGAGAIFSTAKQGMSTSDFAQVSNAVPGMDQMLSAAPSVSSSMPGSSGMMGAATGALGSSGGAVGNMANLAGSFQSLGLDSNMVNQFVPVILDYVKGQGGSSTMSLLQSSLGF